MLIIYDSVLRMKSCPVILSEPDYTKMVRKKKEFG